MSNVSPERLHQIRAVFETVIAAGAGERCAVLERECDGDGELKDAVSRMLAADEEPDTLLDRPGTSLQPVTPESRIGAYRVLGQIGAGGMGAVYLAARDDETFERQVAIKLVHPWVRSRQIVHRFERERKILAQLDHPNIARLLDGGTTAEGTPYFVMEYADGAPVTRYCSERRLNVRQRLAVFCTVCRAVEYAHQHLVVHRDLKPTNILVTSEGVVKLVDFGIAKVLDAETARETQPSVVAMTPEYASPEQVRGGPISTLSDVFSLGVILYELLAGTRPFSGSGAAPQEMARAICELEPAKPSTACASRQLRGDLDNIVLKALRKEPGRRYPSVEQFRADIQRYLGGLPVAARKDTLGYRAWRFAGRNRGAVAAALLLVAGLIAAVVVTGNAAGVANRERAIAREQARQAAEQRTLAERRSREADQARLAAESERQRAEQRLRENRELAASILALPDAVRRAKATEDAARMVARRAEESLARLVSAGGTDPTLAKALALARDMVRNDELAPAPHWRLPRGWSANGTSAREYDAGLDTAVSHRGQASGFLRSKVAGPSGAAVLHQTVDARPYRGKRIRVSAFLRTAGVQGLGNLFATLFARQNVIAADEAGAGVLRGSVEWMRQEVVFDVPVEAETIMFGAGLRGAGTLWIDDVTFEVVDNSVPATRPAAPREPVNLGLDPQGL